MIQNNFTYVHEHNNTLHFYNNIFKSVSLETVSYLHLQLIICKIIKPGHKTFGPYQCCKSAQIAKQKGPLFAGAHSHTAHDGGMLRRTAYLMRFSAFGAITLRKLLARFQCLGT